jgi:hypothetical protein
MAAGMGVMVGTMVRPPAARANARRPFRTVSGRRDASGPERDLSADRLG